MKVHLRFGMHRDVQLIHSEKDRIDGLVIPAHILAHLSPSTPVFVASMHDKPYVIDPMTFVFQNAKEVHLNNAGVMRPSIKKLCDAYHSKLGEKIMAPGFDGPPSLVACLKTDEFCQKVVKFQLEKVADASGSSKANKYLKRYTKTEVTQPRAVIPPYFFFKSVGDDWYNLSLACAKKTVKLAGRLEVSPVICCPASTLNSTDIQTIAGDYGGFARVFVWIDDYVQSAVTPSTVNDVRKLLRALRDAGVKLEALYGGYLLIMSSFDGMSAISHGILYTQNKSTTLVPGSGGAPERYYIPAIHEFRSLSQTDLIVHKHPELICDCAICQEHLGGNPDKIIAYKDNPDLLVSHFLHCRRREADEIGESAPGKESKRLREIFNKYNDSFRALPNPDAFVLSSKMQGLDYLKNWADAFSG